MDAKDEKSLGEEKGEWEVKGEWEEKGEEYIGNRKEENIRGRKFIFDIPMRNPPTDPRCTGAAGYIMFITLWFVATIPAMRVNPTPVEISLLAFILCSCTANIGFNFYQACKSLPFTSCPTDPNSDSNPISNLDDAFSTHWCGICDRERPLGCRHCFVCGQCVIAMDRHYEMIHNCVGLHNFRNVFNLLLWLLLYSLILVVFCFHDLHTLYKSLEIPPTEYQEISAISDYSPVSISPIIICIFLTLPCIVYCSKELISFLQLINAGKFLADYHFPPDRITSVTSENTTVLDSGEQPELLETSRLTTRAPSRHDQLLTNLPKSLRTYFCRIDGETNRSILEVKCAEAISYLLVAKNIRGIERFKILIRANHFAWFAFFLPLPVSSTVETLTQMGLIIPQAILERSQGWQEDV